MDKNQAYYLKCRVKKVHQSFTHTLSGQLRETKGIILIPQENDQKTFFLGAWVPQTDFDTFEALVNVGYPYRVSHARVGVRCADQLCKEPYLYVMEERLEEVLRDRNGQLLMVQVLPESAEKIFASEGGDDTMEAKFSD